MSDNVPDITHDHMAAFGHIVHAYAFAEMGIKMAAAHMAGIDRFDFLILSEPYGAAQLRNVVKSLIKSLHIRHPEEARFVQIVGDLGAFAPLRNDIAHSRWKKGARPNSIKPAGIRISSGSPKLVGEDPNERDWLLSELEHEVDKLSVLTGRIGQLLLDIGAP